nr:MAG TPA: hypothetical protein [Caudoviricetes sp.]
MHNLSVHGIYYKADPYSNNIGFRIRYEEILKFMHTFWF